MLIDTLGRRRMRRDAGPGSEGTLSCAARGGPRANRGLEFPSFASSTSSASSTFFAFYFYPSLLSSRRRPDEGRRPEREPPARELSPACHLPLYFYPSLLSTRNRCNLLKINDGRACYPSPESGPFGGVVAARWRRETASRTASRRSKIPLSNRTPAKEPSR
jgi:hypothetical protein